MASGKKTFMAYVSEGLGSLQDWDQVMAYQRKNGSLFNSPSTTAAAAIHNYNDRALDYLDSLATKLGSSVPTVYPQNIHSHLCMVDTLEKMGISKNFAPEIKGILGMTYRCWLRSEEEVMLDMATCAMAFRLLRMHGYDVTSDGLAQFAEESSFHDSVPGHMNDTKTLLELYKASQVRILEEELILENIGSWSGRLLKQQLCSNKTSRSVMPAEVEYTLKFPFYTTLERLEHKRNIEQFRTDGFQMLNQLTEWKRNRYVPPSMEEYMSVAEESLALGPIVPPSLYLVGPELSEGVIRNPEYIELLRHMNIIGRLLNDLRTYKKESFEGTVNSVLLHALRGGGSSTSVEVGKVELRRAIEASTRELLRLVLREGSAVPRPCKEPFWHMCKVVHLFYLETDGYSSPEELMGAGSAVVLDPLEVRLASCSDKP